MSNTQAELACFDRARFVHDGTSNRIGAVWLIADDRYVAWSLTRKLGELIGIVDAEAAVKAAAREEKKLRPARRCRTGRK
jgi:hypothetical protein